MIDHKVTWVLFETIDPTVVDFMIHDHTLQIILILILTSSTTTPMMHRKKYYTNIYLIEQSVFP